MGSLAVDDSRVWVYESEWKGWNLEVPNLPTQLRRIPPSKLHPSDTVLGIPADVCWNDQYFIACFRSGKVLILDLSNILLQ